MAHQCLKCGNTYPDGSPQILKGCEQCKGTRFFYTDAPLDDAARERLAEKTEVDLERLALGKGAQSPRRIPTKAELPLGRDKDWVELGPTYLRNVVEDVVRRANERTPVFRVGAPAERKRTLAEWVREQSGDAPPADSPRDELLDGLIDAERAWRQRAHEPPAESAPVAIEPQGPPPVTLDEDIVYRRTKAMPRPVSLAGVPVDAEADAKMRRRARALADGTAKATPEELATIRTDATPSLYDEGQAPETVAVHDGVYELDVKRLLEKSPIVVHKDGTYSLHLPSLMESIGKKRR